jgi:hypothetical protein
VHGLVRGSLVALAVAVFAAMAAVVSSSRAIAATACSFDPTGTVTAGPDDGFNTLFRTYGDSNRSLDDWTGGDTTNSVLLPDGRIVWIFSDTFLGAVNANAPIRASSTTRSSSSREATSSKRSTTASIRTHGR